MNNKQTTYIDKLFNEASQQDELLSMSEVRSLVNQYTVNPSIKKLKPSPTFINKWVVIALAVIVSVGTILLWPRQKASGSFSEHFVAESHAYAQNLGIPTKVDTTHKAKEPIANQPVNNYQEFSQVKASNQSTEHAVAKEVAKDKEYDYEVEGVQSNLEPQFFFNLPPTEEAPIYSEETKFQCSENSIDSTFTKTFMADDQNSVYLEGRNGDIEVRVWDKDSVKIEAHLKICAEEISEAKKFLTKFSFAYEICCGKRKTILSNHCISSRAKRKNCNTVYKYKNREKILIRKYAISYVVYIPKYQRLKLKNIKANIKTPDLFADTEIQLYAGKFIGNNVEAELKLNLTKSEAHLSKVKVLNLRTSTSSISIKQCDSMHLAHSFRNTYKLGSINQLHIAFSSSESININTAKALYVQKLCNTELNISYLKQELIVKNQIRKTITIDYVHPEFKKISINGSSNSCMIHFGDDAQYVLDANLKCGKIEYPEARFNYTERKKQGNVFQLRAADSKKAFTLEGKSTVILKGSNTKYTLF